MNIEEFTKTVAKHEGLRLDMYQDTVGVPTIGYGHNLLEPISERAALIILEDDIIKTVNELNDRMPWWEDLPEKAQMVVANMGWPRFSRFKKMLGALEDRDFIRAATEMEDSLWFAQVKSRGVELKQLMLECHQDS